MLDTQPIDVGEAGAAQAMAEPRRMHKMRIRFSDQFSTVLR